MKKKKKLMGRMVQTVLRIPPALDEKVRGIAALEQRSYSSVLRQGITEWMSRYNGARAPQAHDDAYLLRYSGEHVLYEFQMFAWIMDLRLHRPQGIRVADAKEIWGLQMSLIEIFALHLRNLINFLYTDTRRDTDVVASEFFPAGEWRELRGDITATLALAKKRANKEIAHLTTERIFGTPPRKAWDFQGLADEIFPLLQLFVKRALSTRLSPKIADVLQQDWIIGAYGGLK